MGAHFVGNVLETELLHWTHNGVRARASIVRATTHNEMVEKAKQNGKQMQQLELMSFGGSFPLAYPIYNNCE